MKPLHDTVAADRRPAAAPTGQVLKGQYVGAYRSDKGKIKGLRLGLGTAELAVKLPKYLRPMVVRELVVGEFLQVWAYPEGDRWQAINVLPLPEVEAAGLRQQWSELAPVATPVAAPITSGPPAAQPKRLCIEVCTKGKCYKQGGRQIHRELEAALEADPNLSHVSVKGTGCMKACKHGPNLRLPNGRMVHQATPADVLSQIRAQP